MTVLEWIAIALSVVSLGISIHNYRKQKRFRDEAWRQINGKD